MGASRPEARPALLALAAFLATSSPAPGLSAQTAGTATLDGTAYVGGAPMAAGTVVLHHLSQGSQGELDSLSVGPDGSFSFSLPRAPDPAMGDVYFASVRHSGVLYFGPAITEPAQLDSIYEVMAYDTLLAPAAGMPLPLESRSVFFEPEEDGSWRVTDLFQLVNERERTLVTREGGVVWSHPLPASATDVTAGEGEISFAAAEYEDGRLVVRAAIPPGERLFVVRYHVPGIELEIPNVGPTRNLDVLVREPAPPVEVPGLELLDRIELEAGSTYVRFTGVDVTAPSVAIVIGEVVEPPRVQWAAFLLAIVLGAAGLFVLRSAPAGPAGVGPVGRGPAGAIPTGSGTPGRAGSPSAGSGHAREALLHQVARLDEDFAATERGPEERAEYEKRRAALIRRIRTL